MNRWTDGQMEGPQITPAHFWEGARHPWHWPFPTGSRQWTQDRDSGRGHTQPGHTPLSTQMKTRQVSMWGAQVQRAKGPHRTQ